MNIKANQNQSTAGAKANQKNKKKSLAIGSLSLPALPFPLSSAFHNLVGVNLYVRTKYVLSLVLVLDIKCSDSWSFCAQVGVGSISSSGC